MMGISVVGLLVVGAVSVALLYGLVKGLSVMMSLFKSVGAGHATLTCPQCGQQTNHASGRCDSCGCEL